MRNPGERAVRGVGGYDAVPTVLPEAVVTSGEESPERSWQRRARRLLVAEGLAEMVTLSLTDAESNRVMPGFVGSALSPIDVRNPLSSETGQLRRSPLSGLLRALRMNVDRGASFVGAFELGKGYGLDRGAGRVALSTKHTLALTNRGGASTAELLALAAEVRDGVRERYGVTLVNEPVTVGCSL